MSSKDIPPISFPRLERRDLIRFEQRLRSSLARFLPHEACSLYFPGDAAHREPEYIPEEERLLLPLHAPDRDCVRTGLAAPATPVTPAILSDTDASPSLLGIFVARGVPEAAYASLAGHLPEIAALVMENLLLYKAALCDPVTGLYTRRHFLSRVAVEVGAANDLLRLESPSPAKEVFDPDMPEPGSGHTCLGILVIRLHGLRQVVRKHGYTAADAILSLLGASLRDVCPEHGATARVSDYELAVLMPAATAKTCRRLAGGILQELAKVTLPHELTRSRISVTASVGYALYPQDITGGVFMKSSLEQGHVLLRKARLAAALAAERLLAGEDEPVLAFGRILAEGGRVTENLPLSRINISLGSAVNAREGQRFSVWSSEGGKTGVPNARHDSDRGAYKGEIVLLDVRENVSIAEIIHQADPSLPILPGDALTLLPGGVWGAARTAAPGKKPGVPDPATGLLRHGDFLAVWSAGREACDTFSLGLLRIAQSTGTGDGTGESPFSEAQGDENAPSFPDMPEHVRAEQIMAEAARIFKDSFGTDAPVGRYALTSLMAFHPGVSPDELAGKYEKLCASLSERFFPGRTGACVAAGIAGYPYLDFRKADVLENCRKALEYGILLPAPHVGKFDTLAITISADKRFSHGDALGAMAEYGQALLADATNALAWNSLGVVLARLGRHDEARNHFARAIELDPEAMALYNMGYSCQCLGERADARGFYERCLEKDPAHMYALVRLGQMAEAGGDLAAAQSLYARAGTAPEGRGVTRRYLAGLALREGKTEEAREHLHEALALDPNNAVALQMLAEIYLDGNEDAEVAESLARQSVVLRPDRKTGWLVLSRVLEKTGRGRDAREALLRAGAL